MGYVRSERMANITTTLPIPLLEEIDNLIQQGKVRSRSQLIRDAVKTYLKTLD